MSLAMWWERLGGRRASWGGCPLPTNIPQVQGAMVEAEAGGPPAWLHCWEHLAQHPRLHREESPVQLPGLLVSVPLHGLWT